MPHILTLPHLEVGFQNMNSGGTQTFKSQQTIPYAKQKEPPIGHHSKEVK